MKLYEIYTDFLRKKITEDQAAEALNLTLKDFRFRVTKYGKRMPQVLKTLDRIKEDQITRDQAAALLSVTTRQVNNLMKHWFVARPIKLYLVKRATSQVKWEIRKNFAIEVIAGGMNFEQASEESGVSQRQIRRWVAELLDKHFGIVTRDLKNITDRKRRQLADEIQEAEGIEIAKQNVLRSVASGLKSIEDVAKERVMSKRTVASRQNVHRIRD